MKVKTISANGQLKVDLLQAVCIILPVRNERSAICSCLDAILAQDYPRKSISILIVDGLSNDGTRELLFAYEKKSSYLQILDNPSRIVPTGMNIALRQAKGEIIIRVDGHTIIAPDYVRKCVETLQRTQADNVGGKMNAVSANRFGQAVVFATSTPFGIGGSRFHYSDKEEWVDTVYMGAWPRRVFTEIGLFDEELVRDQDDEFNYRLREHGGRIFLSPSIKSEYTVRSSPGALWRQYYQYGYWKVRVLQKHPRQMSLRQFIPPVFVMALLVSIVCAFISTVRPLSPVVLTAYLLANIVGSIYTASRRSWASLPFLPPIFAILHISYGLGFLVGLVKFTNRWGDKCGKTPDLNGEYARKS